MMKKNTVLILIAIIAILITVSVLLSSNFDSNRSDDQSAGQKFIPKLYDKLNDVSSIEITNASGKVVIVKSSEADGLSNIWKIKSKDNYPGDVTQIRKTLIEIAELEKVEAKTKKEKNYSKLGVQSFDEASKVVTGQSSYITVSAGSETLASVIMGNKKSGHTSRARGIKNLNYARFADDAQVWLVAGNLTLPAFNNFMDTELTKIPVARIKAVEISHPKGSAITISKKSKTDKDFVLKQLPKNKELSDPGILNTIASALSNLSFDDVSNKSSDDKFNNPVKVQFVAFNGLTINMNVVNADNKYYLWLDAKSTKPLFNSLKKEDVENKDKSPDAKQEATDINKKHSRWLYTIPTYSGQILTKQLTDLIKAKTPKKK
ncbi:MAG: DUF4340 domain-containing protein [Gammaproteobacteria bacterium]